MAIYFILFKVYYTKLYATQTDQANLLNPTNPLSTRIKAMYKSRKARFKIVDTLH